MLYCFWQALQQIIVGCGEAFRLHMTPELQDVIFRALLHQNRFVRETCYDILAVLCTLCSHKQLLEFSDSVAERLQDGLNENWSQVCNKSQNKPHNPCEFEFNKRPAKTPWLRCARCAFTAAAAIV